MTTEELIAARRAEPWREALRKSKKNKERTDIPRVEMNELDAEYRSHTRLEEVNLGLTKEQANHKQDEHSGIQKIRRTWSSSEFMPYQNPPKCGYKRRPLPQTVRNGSSGLFRSDHTKRLPDTPDNAS